MKFWKFVTVCFLVTLLAGAEHRLESSQKFQNVKHALGETCSDVPAIDRVIVTLLA